jgi:hypothetical protein
MNARFRRKPMILVSNPAQPPDLRDGQWLFARDFLALPLLGDGRVEIALIISKTVNGSAGSDSQIGSQTHMNQQNRADQRKQRPKGRHDTEGT